MIDSFLIGKKVFVVFRKDSEVEILGKYPEALEGVVEEVNPGGILLRIMKPQDYRGEVTHLLCPWHSVANVEVSNTSSNSTDKH
ncbi:MAG: hypothetical protein ACE5H1_11850 [Thermodesulfobacteriota bacterium]